MYWRGCKNPSLSILHLNSIGSESAHMKVDTTPRRQQVPFTNNSFRIGNETITTAQYAELRNIILSLCDFLQQTGAGALSMADLETQQPTWDESTASAAAHDSYTRRTRIQENATVVANL